MNHIKWTNGETYERSKRKYNKYENCDINEKMEMDAYTSSLNHDENTWEMLNQSTAHNGFNRREELGNKLSDRDMIQQIGNNPFLSQNSYIDDIMTRDNYLKPINTTQGQKI